MNMIEVESIEDGLHPSEVAVTVRDAGGRLETIFMGRRQLTDGRFIPIGYPVGRDGDNALVELPRETMRGSWRVWVPAASLVEQVAAA